MKTVFVSGCYDVLHAGHLQFFDEARALGDHLTVCFASEEALWIHKERRPTIPDTHKQALLESLRMVDQVVAGHGCRLGFDFEDHFLQSKPNILAVTQDSEFKEEKRALCESVGAEFVVLEKTAPRVRPISTSEIVRMVRAPRVAPLRVDFAGGWLDVPRHAIPGEFVVNCAISPTVSLTEWPYEKRAGLGGSGAWALINGFDGVAAECELGVGWQDPAVIRETGCCVWESGPRPVLEFKRRGDFLKGCMAIAWTGGDHDTPGVANNPRDYAKIAASARLAREGVLRSDVPALAQGVVAYHEAQIDEGMQPLPAAETALAWKYCGGGYGGYALYLFPGAAQRDGWVQQDTQARRAVEPYCEFS